jgi:hypothetical protein
MTSLYLCTEHLTLQLLDSTLINYQVWSSHITEVAQLPVW